MTLEGEVVGCVQKEVRSSRGDIIVVRACLVDNGPPLWSGPPGTLASYTRYSVDVDVKAHDPKDNEEAKYLEDKIRELSVKKKLLRWG